MRSFSGHGSKFLSYEPITPGEVTGQFRLSPNLINLVICALSCGLIHVWAKLKRVTMALFEMRLGMAKRSDLRKEA